MDRQRSLFRSQYRVAVLVLAAWLSACCLEGGLPLRAQEAAPPPDQLTEEDQKPLPGDWAVSLLDTLSNSAGPEAREDLLRAIMRTGPAAIPTLETGLKDDRTAELAAQSLAYIGGDKAIKLLWALQEDRRDLNLRRFYYGALAEYDAPQAVDTLLNVVKLADSEPDRTVTETAIVALTVRSDPKALPPLREAVEKIDDLVIRLDLENAIEVIDRRSKAQAAGKLKSSGSVDDAVRNYFAPALELPPAEAATTSSHKAGAQGTTARAAAKPASQSPVKVQIQSLAFSPDQTRTLAHVVFDAPSASATYDIILQKQFGNWTVVSVWLGEQSDKSLPDLPVAPAGDSSAD